MHSANNRLVLQSFLFFRLSASHDVSCSGQRPQRICKFDEWGLRGTVVQIQVSARNKVRRPALAQTNDRHSSLLNLCVGSHRFALTSVDHCPPSHFSPFTFFVRDDVSDLPSIGLGFYECHMRSYYPFIRPRLWQRVQFHQVPFPIRSVNQGRHGRHDRGP